MKGELDEDGQPRFECKRETTVTSLSFVDQTILVESEAEKEAFDHVISAIDLKQLAKILPQGRDTFAQDIETIKYGSLVTCNLVFAEACLDPQLLYLLIPDGFYPADSEVRMEQVTFSSHLFPIDESSTLVTATLAVPTDYVLDESYIQDFCLELLQSQQLQCGKLQSSTCYLLKDALPIFEPNHFDKISAIRTSLPTNLHLVGNYLELSSSITGCIGMAKQAVGKIGTQQSKL